MAGRYDFNPFNGLQTLNQELPEVKILRLNGGRWPPIEAKQGLPEKSSMRRPATMMWCSPAASLTTNNWAC